MFISVGDPHYPTLDIIITTTTITIIIIGGIMWGTTLVVVHLNRGMTIITTTTTITGMGTTRDTAAQTKLSLRVMTTTSACTLGLESLASTSLTINCTTMNQQPTTLSITGRPPTTAVRIGLRSILGRF